MVYYAGANAIAFLHAAFILFVIFGGFAVLRWPKLIWLHLPAAVWGVLIEFAGWYCPLTTWENNLLRRAGQAGYDTGFVEHYVFAAIYPAGLTRGMQVTIGIIVLAINAFVYARLAQRP
jgi:hypothetical protein